MLSTRTMLLKIISILLLLGSFAMAGEKTFAQDTNYCGYSIKSVIREKYVQLGGPNSFLGCPTTNTLQTPGGFGLYAHFQGGSIYWHPGTGAYEIHGAIRTKWASLGWEKSALRYPITNELTAPDKIGRFSHFQGGSIYWHPASGAHVIYGIFREKWASFGWEQGSLGYPTTDVLKAPNTLWYYIHFQGGSIYWNPLIGAHVVQGGIRTKWASLGGEKSLLGYPMSDQLNGPMDIRYSVFQGGLIGEHSALGSHTVDIHRLVTENFSTMGIPIKSEGRASIRRILPIMGIGGKNYQNVIHVYHRVKGAGFPADQVVVDFDFYVALDFINNRPCARILKIDADVDIDAGWDIVTFGLSELGADEIENQINNKIAPYQNGVQCIPLF